MKKLLLFCLLIVSVTSARENPFFPSEGVKDLPITSNSDRRRPQLTRSAITLPDSARILKKVTIKYQNMDGSLQSKSIVLDHNVDWHVPIFISQSYNNSSSKKRHQSKKSSKRARVTAISDFITYSISKNRLELRTQDKLLRHFMMINPHRVVIDFKRESDVKSKNIALNTAPFKMLKYGNHSNYYRIVAVLDGKYRYTLKRENDKITVTLR
jgi:hypothetical protein